jgi:hypothetical protein
VKEDGGKREGQERRKNKKKGNFEICPWKDHRMEKKVKK